MRDRTGICNAVSRRDMPWSYQERESYESLGVIRSVGIMKDRAQRAALLGLLGVQVL